MGERSFMGEFEQMVLLAVLQRADDPRGSSIAEELERSAGREVSRGGLYSALNRLEEKGYLRWRAGDATPERGGHPSRLFEVTPEGMEALRATRRAYRELSRGLGALLGEEAG